MLTSSRVLAGFLCVSLSVACSRHGNYYSIGRTRIQDYVPVFNKFININWTDPVKAAEPESIAVRNYLRQVRRQRVLSGEEKETKETRGRRGKRRLRAKDQGYDRRMVLVPALCADIYRDMWLWCVCGQEISAVLSPFYDFQVRVGPRQSFILHSSLNTHSLVWPITVISCIPGQSVRPILLI